MKNSTQKYPLMFSQLEPKKCTLLRHGRVIINEGLICMKVKYLIKQDRKGRQVASFNCHITQ